MKARSFALQGHPTQLLGFFGPRAEGRCGSCWLNGKAEKKGYIMPFFKPKVILKFTFGDFEVKQGVACLMVKAAHTFQQFFPKADAAVCIEGDDMNEWIRRGGFAYGIAHHVTPETKTCDADLWARTRPVNNSLPLSFDILGGIW